MKNTKNLIGIIIASALIAGGIAGSVYALIADNKKEEPVADSSVTTEIQHDAVEYIYDENGDLKSEIYYKNNVYDRRKDYFNVDGDEYFTIFDKDRN